MKLLAKRRKELFIFASVSAVHKRIASGERADVAIGTQDGIEALVRLGPGVDGTQAVIARSVLALAWRSSAPAPTIGEPASLASVLAAARSIAAPDARAGVPGGAQVVELLERLQLADTLQSRMRWQLDAREAPKRVAAGEVEFALAALNDLITAAGVEVSAPIAEPKTNAIVYAAVVVRSASDREAARNFIRHLRSREAADALRKAGYVAIE